MKKNYHAIFCTIAIFLAAACTKETKAPVEKPVDPSEEPAQPGADEGELVPLTITVTGTKTYIDGSSVAWEEGESIAVYDGTAIREFTMTSLSPLKFSGSIDAGASYAWAVYPYADSGISATESSVVASLPAEQTLSGHNAAAGALLTAGKINLATGAVTLLNLHGTVSVTIAHDDIAEISVSGSNLAGTATFTEAGAVAGTVSNPASEIVLKPSGAAFENGSTVYVAALPGASVSAVSIKRTDGYKATKSLSTPKSIVRNSGFAAGELDKAALEWIYYVNDADDLMAWHSGHSMAWADAVESNYPNATNHKVLLTGDCNMSGKNWAYKHLRCEFDGAGHKIYNVVITRESNSSDGLREAAFFNCLYSDIHDVIFGSSDGISYDGNSAIVNNSTAETGNWQVASLFQVIAAEASVRISNVINYIPISVTESAIGKYRVAGILGIAGGTGTATIIEHCKNYGNLSDNSTTDSTNGAGNMMGGIVCVLNNGNGGSLLIDDCENYGNLTSVQPLMNCIGGILGRRYNNSSSVTTTVHIKDCKNFGNITHSNSTSNVWTNIGGIMGFALPGDDYCKDGSDYYTKITGCINGYAEGGSQPEIKSAGKNYTLGGIIGWMSASYVDNCKNYAAITAATSVTSSQVSTPVGGIVGTVGSANPYENNSANQPAALAVVDNCRNEGVVSATLDINGNGGNTGNAGASAGGIAGCLKGYAQFSNNINIAEVTCNNVNTNNKYAFVGGIAGYVYSSHDMTTPAFTGNKNSGTVTAKTRGTKCAGGIVGKLTASIASCENYGTVSGGASTTGSIMGMYRSTLNTESYTASSCVVGLGHTVHGVAVAADNYNADGVYTASKTYNADSFPNLYFGQVNPTGSSTITISGTTSAATAPSL